MSKRFMISDLHFDHTKLVEYRGHTSVEEMNAALIAGWRSVVTDSDKVFVLGDVALNTTPESLGRHLSALPGSKVLIMGNHDTDPAKIAVYQKHFVSMVGCMEYKRAILTHIPVHPGQLVRFAYNIHGHVHKNTIKQEWGILKPNQGYEGDLLREPDSRYINVSCEVLDYVPRTFEELTKNRGITNDCGQAGEAETPT